MLTEIYVDGEEQTRYLIDRETLTNEKVNYIKNFFKDDVFIFQDQKIRTLRFRKGVDIVMTSLGFDIYLRKDKLVMLRVIL